MKMNMMVLGLLVSGCAADTFGRMTVRPGGAVRNAEACYTSAGSSSMDRCALCARDRPAATRTLVSAYAPRAGLSACTRCAGCRVGSRR